MNIDGATESLINDLSDTATVEINYEDLIKVSNLSNPEFSKDETKEEVSNALSIIPTANTITSTISSNPPSTTTVNSIITTRSTVATTNTNSKTVQKLGSAATTTTGSSGQVVIIQGASGTSVPIRIASSGTLNNSQNNDNHNKQVTIQVLKMSDGSFVQIKNNKALNLTNLSNITKMNVGAKKSVSGQNQSIIIKNTSATTTPRITGTTASKTSNTNTSLGAQILKSVVSSIDNQKLTSGSKPKVIESTKLAQKIISISHQSNSATRSNVVSTSLENLNIDTTTVAAASTTVTLTTTTGSTTTTTSSTATTAVASKLITQKLLSTENKDILIKTEGDSGTKQILVPHHVLKLSSSSGSIQAIQIPGKAGVQYVKVLNATSSSNGNSTTTAPVKSLSTNKMSSNKEGMANLGQSGQKLILNSKARQNISSITTSKDTFTQKSLITIPMLKKITEKDKTLTFTKKNDCNELQSHQKTIKNDNKILNIQQLITNSNKEPRLLTISKSKELLKNIQEQTINSSENETERSETNLSSSKKLFSVLKPSIQETSVTTDIEDNNNSYPSLLRKLTPSPPADGPRRKHCNCTKSQCLKLYCDCFANGEFCQDCNCKECFNNLDNEIERQKAIKICLERNPSAFKPKITKAQHQSDLRLHNKGCNCKRSGCLKNYCECYEAKIACSANCKCVGCRNNEDRPDVEQVELPKISQNYGRGITLKRSYNEMETTLMPSSILDEPTNKQTYNFITEDVVDATVQCMFAQTEECKKSEINEKNSERMIVEELGRCLVEIIDFSIRNMDN